MHQTRRTLQSRYIVQSFTVCVF